jgi:hypothetical protein
MKTLSLSCALILGLLLQPPQTLAQQAGPRTVSATATLSVLAGTVHRVPVGSRQPQAVTGDITLNTGDRVLTDPKSTALITFLDGSTVTVQPESDVEVKKVELSGGKFSNIIVRINFGTVWARVVRLLDPSSSFSLESNTAVATAHEGLIGGKVNMNDSFECWTRAGVMKVADEPGQRYVTLMPGEKTTVQPSLFAFRFGFRLDPDPVPTPFSVNQSALKVTASDGVFPLIEMEDKTRVAGFVTPGVEVNQVFGSFTGASADGARIVEVPAGVRGPFRLILDGAKDGPFKVTVTGLYNGEPVYRQELAGTIRKGERFSTEIIQQLDQELASHPKMARIVSGKAAPLNPLTGPLPGSILLSTREMVAPGGN